MHVHEIGRKVVNRAAEPRDQPRIEIAAHRHLDHRGRHMSGSQRAAARADEHVVHAFGSQTFDQVTDLGAAAVQVSTRFDVKDPHLRMIRLRPRMRLERLQLDELMRARAPKA